MKLEIPIINYVKKNLYRILTRKITLWNHHKNDGTFKKKSIVSATTKILPKIEINKKN